MPDTDIALMGPHAIASYESRMRALQEFGVNTKDITLSDQKRSLLRQSKARREVVLRNEYDFVSSL